MRKLLHFTAILASVILFSLLTLTVRTNNSEVTHHCYGGAGATSSW